MFDEAELGRRHAIDYIEHPRTFGDVGPRTYAYADAALEELERQQRQHSELLEVLLDGGNQGARQLNVDPVQGLREIVQNADDLAARKVCFGVRTTGGKRQLLIVHDGHGVDLLHVLPMIYPFMSTKRGDARSKGRFGVGLKTLSRLGGDMSIHSRPFHFGSRENLAVPVPMIGPIPGFYDPDAVQTLFSIMLDDGTKPDFLSEWFSDWTAADLLFLDSIRTIELHDLDAASVIGTVAVEEVGVPREFQLKVGDVVHETVERAFDVQGRRWRRFVSSVLVPPNRSRQGKATPKETPVGIAIPEDGMLDGHLHVALPTTIATGTSFAVDGQFDPATSREGLVDDPWNRWLLDTATGLAGALAVRLAGDGSPLAWSLVPIGAEPRTSVRWLHDRLATGWSRAVAHFAGQVVLPTIQEPRGLSDFAYCDSAADGILAPEDYEALSGRMTLPMSLHDPEGRWRVVLDALGVSARIGQDRPSGRTRRLRRVRLRRQARRVVPRSGGALHRNGRRGRADGEPLGTSSGRGPRRRGVPVAYGAAALERPRDRRLRNEP